MPEEGGQTGREGASEIRANIIHVSKSRMAIGMRVQMKTTHEKCAIRGWNVFFSV